MASIVNRNGRYSVVYTYVNREGKRKQKWEACDSKEEAERRKKEIEYKDSRGTLFVTENMTVEKLLEEFVELYGNTAWSMSYYDTVNSRITNYILPHLGKMKLEDVTPYVLEKYYQKLQTLPGAVNPSTGRPKVEHITAGTVNEVHKILRTCFNQAVRWGLIRDNPANHVKPPKRKSKKREILTADMLLQVLDSCEDEYLKIMVNLAFAASLRLGELLGLTWDCVDPALIEKLMANPELMAALRNILQPEGK